MKMLDNISPEIIEALENALGLIIPTTFAISGVRLALSIVSGGSSYGFFDYISDGISDLIEHIKLIFHKPKEKMPVDFCSEYDNGFFNSDIYNSGGENNE
ncbi:MAG: hypothetical protein ACI4J0_02405 [Huintestinicola sp.]|uniref:hypothetical protein n=1 Tax=Huintestinicola sp. TaxID=2981661 RepID=UPI003EFC532B